jgi:hypothetical protein
VTPTSPEPSLEPPLNNSPSSVKSSSATQAPTTRPEVERLCILLADLIEANGCRRPEVTRKWRDSCRLLIDRDGIAPNLVEGAIRWSQADEFWRGAVMSMPKLREKYDQMLMQKQRRESPAQRIPTTTARVQAGLSLVEELRAEETQAAQLMIGGTA